MDEIVKSMTEFTRSPDALRKARQKLAEMCGTSFVNVPVYDGSLIITECRALDGRLQN